MISAPATRIRSVLKPRGFASLLHGTSCLTSKSRGFASLLHDTSSLSSNTPQFVVGTKNGFLPRQDPLVKLPPSYEILEDLLQRMPLKLKKDGKPGLLATGGFGDAVHKELPEYDFSNVHDSHLLTALFRDYTFASSAYLLEPCDIMNRKKGDYGLGRDKLPRNLAVPLSVVAQKIGAKPFMEYAQSYSLFNWQRKDRHGDLSYENLDLIRGFAGADSEHGFILVHVAMVAHSGEQVRTTLAALEAVENDSRTKFNAALSDMLKAFQKINGVMDTMWRHSAPADYVKFRTFIMGTKNQPMFPNGVIYEGVSDQATFYRGESGANDSIIPTADNFLEITQHLPSNPLTQILRDFRSYRPSGHNEWVSWVEGKSSQLGVRAYAEKDASSNVLYLAMVDQVREFRARHWNFTKEYIIKYSAHPVATGGSPIATWLPNQLAVVLDVMVSSGRKINMAALSPEGREMADELTERANTQRRVLLREVDNLKTKFKNQEQLARV
ncbi:hypothetical protein SmJEL517_g01065 [Synchytrium microbalum]|uniref:Indoleamine 2,3-dioxygenase n=1 Tax=Synchytrium microbalum TaxID=1806994 RepID=A0A507CG85_9FUNG|nr:uncharacterized protein SmJEL517_g01065 [Synchytrium microbalum]TPX37016.1 hypothetical protein SmJEL517_g01065 [Synchytrium microbalum]